jgi:stage V sporulation protein K
MNKAIPNRTILLIKADKLSKEIVKFISYAENSFEEEQKIVFFQKVRDDGCSILYRFLGYESIENNYFEFALGLVWYIKFSKEYTISPVDIIHNWGNLDQDTQALLLSNFKESTHKLSFFHSIKFLHDSNIRQEDKINLISKVEVLIIDFFTSIINIDNDLSDYERIKYDEIKKMFQIDYSKVEMNREVSSSVQSETLESVLDELQQLIGLSEIKNEVVSLIDFVKINELRKSRGLPTVGVSLHSVFYGPPGTGKTTIARLVSKALKCIGILKKGHLIEADRSQLVAGYVGQTAIKTREVLDKALDGVLFIDEAYTLNSDDGFGKEAIETILKYMEDHRDRLVVIVAGYENEMHGFIKSNPGLKSRFNKFFYFSNYSSSELLEIFSTVIEKNKFKISEEAKNKVFYIINDAIINEGNHFGNARYIRNLYEQIIRRQFNRVSRINHITEEHLCEITTEDLPSN